MWEAFEARLDENEREYSAPRRRELFDVIRNSGLRPGEGVTKKMLAFRFAQGERLLWKIKPPARNVFFHTKWQALLTEPIIVVLIYVLFTKAANLVAWPTFVLMLIKACGC